NQLKEAQSLALLSEILQNIFKLFLTKGSHQDWSSVMFHKFLTGLDQQEEALQTSLVQEPGEEKTLLLIEDSIQTLKNSFQRIKLPLTRKVQSCCAWYIVILDVKRLISSSENSATKERKKE
uniref:Uncharacterized protein n=1 Tax=Sus scrofa TaxID=9823 RepID=A0A8D1EQK6_PIG